MALLGMMRRICPLLLLASAPCFAESLAKELVVSYRACTAGQGCHVMDQVSFYDSHVLLLTSANYQQSLHGRLINIDSSCPSVEGDGSNGSADILPKKARTKHHRTIGLVQCGQCPLSDMLREAERLGVAGIVIANTNECGRPTKEFLESATNTRVPVAFVASKVASEIQTMQQQIIALQSQPPHSEDGVRHDAFIHLSIHDSADRESHVVNHLLASTHILLATMAVLALLIYVSLACSVGSLRYIPREIAPEIFGSRSEPVDKEVLERLPLVPVEWEVSGFSDSDEESRCETPTTDFSLVRESLQQQLAGIIVRSGEGSYSFTEEKKCAICLDSYVHNESLRLLPCKHAFHRKCIDTWLLSDDMTAHCPVCKSNITDGLRLLDKHGYSEILNLLYSSNRAARSLPAKPAPMPQLYFYHVVRNSIARLWNREP